MAKLAMEDSSTIRLTPTAPEPELAATDHIYADLTPRPRAPTTFSAATSSSPDALQRIGSPAAAVPAELRRTRSDLGHIYPNLASLPVDTPPGFRMYMPHRSPMPRFPMPPLYSIPMPRAHAVGDPSASSAGFHVGSQAQKAIHGDHPEATVLLWCASPPHEAPTAELAAKPNPPPPPSQKKPTPLASTTSAVLSGSASASMARLRSRSRKRCRLPDPSLACFCFISFLIFVVGCATLVLGAMAFFGEERLAALVQADSSGKMQAFNVLGLLRSSSVFLVVVGAAVLFLGFLGCCGVLMNSKAMVAAFGLLVLLLIVAQVTLGLLAWVYRDAARDSLKQALVTSIKLNYEGQVNTSNAISQAIDFVQVTLGCCGVRGAADFNDTPWYRQYRPRPDSTVPRTCCQLRGDDSDHTRHNQQQPQRQPQPPPKRQPHGHQPQEQQTSSSSSASSSAPFALPRILKLANESCPHSAPGPENPNTDTPCLEVVKAVVTKYLAVLLSLAVALVLVEVASVCSACNVLATLRANERKETAHSRASKRYRL